MASTADFRNGLCLEYNNDLYTIVQFQHVKPGKGPAFVRTKLKSLTTGRVIENTFTAGAKVNTARLSVLDGAGWGIRQRNNNKIHGNPKTGPVI